MRFGLDDDREALRSTARELLTELCPASAVRAAWVGAPDDAAWSALADIGALAVLAPPSEGGLGLDETYLVPVLEEAGRAALPHPLTETALVAASLGVTGLIVATDLGTAGPIMVAGGSVVEPITGADDGTHTVVASATFAEAFLLVSGRGLRLYEAHEVDVEPVETVDASRHCGRAQPRALGQLVTEDPAAVAAAFDRGVLGTAAELLGLSRAMLELTVDYAAQRHQFGKPIGAFQLVQSMIVEMATLIDTSRYLCYRALDLLDRGVEARMESSMAKYYATEAAVKVTSLAIQVHGTYGLSTEYPLEQYFRDARMLTMPDGTSEIQKLMIGREILGISAIR